jgi:hypothetical protein
MEQSAHGLRSSTNARAHFGLGLVINPLRQ